MSAKTNRGDKGVSPLIGFILLMAILMGMIGILQSTAVPEWNKAVERRHFTTVKYDFVKASEAISNLNENPLKVVLKAGVDYPNYYILFSPQKASTTISTIDLSINIAGTQTMNTKTSAIILEPNYLYSSRSKLVYEHSAVFRLENDIALVESGQIFSRNENEINLNIIKAEFTTFATTEDATLVLVPITTGKNVFSGSITFESYNEKTAERWEEILSLAGLSVVREGRNITIQANNVTLSISLFKVYTSDVFAPEEFSLEFMNITPLTQEVFLGSTVTLGVRLVSEFGAVKGRLINLEDSCSGESLVLRSDEFGEVWYNFYASKVGNCEVSFNTDSSTSVFNIAVRSIPSGGGGGGALEINWYKYLDGAVISDYTWNVSQIGNQTNFFAKVIFTAFGSPMPEIPIYFTINNTSVLNINSKDSVTNSTGWAKVNLTALENGTSAIAAIVGNSFGILNITVTNVAPGNRPPTQPSISTDKRYYRSGETITATAYGSTDPDGDPITYYYKFYDFSDGRLLRDWSTTNTYTVTTGEEGHVVRIYAKACDDKNACSPESYIDVGVVKVIEIRDQSQIFDSYVRSGSNNTNYGTLSLLYAGYTTTTSWRITRTFIKFALPQELSDAKILNATLYLYKSGHTGTPTNIALGAHRVLTDWSETTIRWNNQPSFSANPTASITPPTTNNLYIGWNVTSDVKAFVDGTPNYGWCIKSSNENQNTRIQFNSKENTNASTLPYLYIEYAPKVD
ncbi:MAG: DNRLRE domain-containing protein [Archaeoglobaceae archaeon]